MPVTLRLTSDRGPARTFNFQVVRDQLFTPLMTYSALLNTLSSYERQFGVATYQVRGEARLVVLERRRHLVERGREVGQLVAPGDVDPVLEIAAVLGVSNARR